MNNYERDIEIHQRLARLEVKADDLCNYVRDIRSEIKALSAKTATQGVWQKVIWMALVLGGAIGGGAGIDVVSRVLR
jgi:hypothetical protein